MKKFITLTVLLFSIFSYSQTLSPTLDTDDIELVKVELTNFQYRITYYDNVGNFKYHLIPFVRGGKYVHKRIKWFNFSAMTIPFKVRPEIQNLKTVAKGDLKNFGLHVGIFNHIWKVYLQDGTINEYKFSVGALFAPAAEEFNTLNTGGVLTTATTQAVLSTGLTVVMSYRGINFAFIPAGVDFGLTDDSKSWKYNGKYWYGIGIGIDSKLIGF